MLEGRGIEGDADASAFVRYRYVVWIGLASSRAP